MKGLFEMIKKILVPIDGSDHANKALDLAADIAEKYDAKLIVLHALLRRTSIDKATALCKELDAPETTINNVQNIVDNIYTAAAASPYGLPVYATMPEEIAKEIGALIIDKAKQNLTLKGLKDLTTQILDADPVDCILTAVDHEKPDMIFMGSRGLGKLSSVLMGSVSSKVNHLAPCTCVTVK